MDIMSQFNLPSYTKGKSFSEASALIAKKFEGRNSPEDMETLNELQGRLQQAQEFVKAKEQERSQPQDGGQHKMPDGSMMEGATHMDPSIPPQEQQMQDPNAQAVQENMFALGGMIKGKDNANTFADGGKFGELSKFLIDNQGMLNKGVDSSRLNSLNAQGYISNDGLGNKADTFGGNYGQGQNTSVINPSLQVSEGPFGGRSAVDSMIDRVGQPLGYDNNYIRNDGLGNKVDNFGGNAKNKDYLRGDAQYSGQLDSMGIEDMSGIKGSDTSGVAPLGGGKSSSNDSDGIDSNGRKTNKFNPAELLRYAGPATTAYQLATQKKPEDVSLGRISRKYDEQLVDERTLQNTVQNSAANAREALRGASGGSAASLSANLLASQLQSQKAQSGAYAQASAENRNEKRQGQQFDLGVDQINLQQGNAETNMNLARRAGYETNRSRLMAQLGQDLGGIGQEELFKKYPELAGLGYDWKGRKIKTT